MRGFYFSILACIAILVACDTKKQPVSLTGSFIESLMEAKFEILEPYFPTVEFFKSLESNGPEKPDSTVLKFLEESNTRLKENWTRISERIKADNLDLSKVEIKESFSTQPFWNKKITRMVVVYSYNNRNWDDLEFVVGELNTTNFLLEIPNPENVFSMKDSSLQASSDIRFELEIKKPEFKKMLQEKVEKIISYAKENKIKEFTENMAYNSAEPGNPEPDSAATAEGARQIAEEFMQRINVNIDGCDKPDYGDVNNLKLPDGMWIVIQVKCNKKFIHFAFIRAGDKLLLNDVDAIDQ